MYGGEMDELPDWLTNEFLTECLQNQEGNKDIVVTNFTVSPVAPPGNNYGSFIIRINVEYKCSATDSKLHSTSLILKSEVTQGAVKEMFDNLKQLQQSEYDFYYKFLQKAGKLTNTRFAPKSFFSPLNGVIILEDLKKAGFVMADRTKQLDFDHCRLYIEAAASMHATSFAVHKEDPGLIESMGKEKLFTNESSGSEAFKLMIKGGLEVFARTIEKNERFEKYARVVRESIPLLWDAIVEAHKPSHVINTINQGDPWLTNMMFKYDDMGNVIDVKIIDFQCLRYGSPINDVVFFIWSSANNDVKLHRLNDLYKIYVETFNNKMEEVRCTERLTFEHLKECLTKLSPLVIYQVAGMIPLMTHPEPVDFSKFLSKDSENSDQIVVNNFKEYYSEKYCNEQVPHLITELEKAGVFGNLENLIKKA